MKQTTSFIYVALAFLAGLAFNSGAVDYHVATTQELQNALTRAANNGADDVICLSAGWYTGNFNFNSAEANSLAIQAEIGVSNTAVIIDPAGGGRGLNITNTANSEVSVRGITFLRNCGSETISSLRIGTGSAASSTIADCQFISPINTKGIGLEIASGLNITIRRCSLIGNNQGGYMGNVIDNAGIIIDNMTSGNMTMQHCLISSNLIGASLNGCNITLSNNTFHANSKYGGVRYWSRGGENTIVFSENTFIHNSNTWYSPAGGGAITLYANFGVIHTELSHNDFIANTGEAAGAVYGGLDSNNGGAVGATIVDNTFVDNRALAVVDHTGAGAVRLDPVNVAYIRRNVFRNNTGCQGGGLRCTVWSGGTLELNHNIFIGNSAQTGYAGAAYCNGMSSYGDSIVDMYDNILENNVAGWGGGLVVGAPYVQFKNNIVVNNSAIAGYAGGVFVEAPKVQFNNNLVANNAAIAGSGGGIYLKPTVAMEMVNNTIVDNSASGNGGGVRYKLEGDNAVLKVYNNIIWGNIANGNGVDLYITGTGSWKEFMFNDAHGLDGVWDIAENNIDMAPAFFDPVNGDYHLRATSACLNAGTNGLPSIPATDLDGNSRTNGVRVDLGCYEFNNTNHHPADANLDWTISMTEYEAYAAAWKNSQPWAAAPASIPADYVTRAGYLQAQGGAYHNDGAGAPLCWKAGR